jgi:SAM-dependent methyltransferase
VPPRSFDRIGRPYRWLEYLTFGRALERCRGLQLDRLAAARQVLVLGDGDGRFTAGMLRRHPSVHVVAVDSSASMLTLLVQRAQALGATRRLSVFEGNAVRLLAGSPGLAPAGGFDCVCSHFFLDCLSTSEVEQLVAAVCPRLAPGALWIVSEFETPSWWSRLIVALLYRAFSLLAGLETQQLPAWRPVFEARFACEVDARSLGGLLSSTAWRWSPAALADPGGPEATAPVPGPSYYG